MITNEALVHVKVGDRIKFAEEVQRYTVQARGERFIVCTRPFAPQKTVLYTVVDLVEQVRGTEGVVLSIGAETREQCDEMLARLEGRDSIKTEVSYRNRIALCVDAVEPKYGACTPDSPLCGVRAGLMPKMLYSPDEACAHHWSTVVEHNRRVTR